MKLNKIIVVGFIFLAILSIGYVSAEDNATDLEITSPDEISLDDDVLMEEDASQDLDVEVTNVFHGYENTITVNCPNATGSVDITVGDRTYSPEFVEGRATQAISDYEIGVNNVSVKYNNLTKLASFKGLDGIVTYKTFYDYFNVDNNYTLQDYIPSGVTLDFQGNITYINLNKTEDYNILYMKINKPINIISTTGDAFIDFNGASGALLGTFQGSTFAITNGGSWTNVTGITIRNTQVWLYNTHHVTLDRIRVLVEDTPVGSGVGATSVRANSTWCTVKNSYFYTRNNGGSSTLVGAWADYCTFDNNTIEVEGRVGNLLYLTTYNVDFPAGIIPNCHNRLTNNRLTGAGADISWMIVLSGEDNLIENNTVNSPGVGINNQYIDTSWYGGDAVPEGNRYIGNKLYGGCAACLSANSIVSDNYFSGKVTAYANVTFCNNYVGGSLGFPSYGYFIMQNNTIKDASIKNNNFLSIYTNNTFDTVSIEAENIIFENNVVNKGMSLNINNVWLLNNTLADFVVGISSSNITIRDNVVSGLVSILSDGNTVTGNRITSTKDYAIDLKKSRGNVVTDNYLLSAREFGNSAVKSTNENIIRDNYPIAPDVLISVELVDNFDNLVTVTVPNSTGNVTIQVSDKKYSLTLANGIAAQRISGLDPGTYNLTVRYQDDKGPIYATNATTIRVPKIDTYIFQVPVCEYIEGNVKLSITLPDDAYGTAVINNLYQFDVAKGSCSAVLNFTEGEHDITVDFTNSSRYADKSIQVHIKVNHNPESTLALTDVSTYDLTGKITAKLTDYSNAPISNVNVTFNINGKDITVLTDGDGVATADYKLDVGNYNVSASFQGNDKYNQSSAEAALKVLSRFTGNKNIVMNYYDGTKYSVRVMGDNGKYSAGLIVTLSINGKKSTAKTDKKGYASLTITNLPGKYAVTATYKGQSIKNTVQVKQNLKASKVTVKKSAKSFVLKATLSKVKGKKLTFKFNGKTYTAKTDKKGVAKVTIKKNIIKKLKKGKKYAFTVKYVLNTVKGQITVK